jgi:catechol 2,3-dioxygenase-like lactoylglutathione lyase family enzyme
MSPRFDLDGVRIELVPAPPGTAVPRNGNGRLCFEVSNIEETLEQIHARGIHTSNIKEKKDGWLAFFLDPDGNELSLWECAKNEDALEIVRPAMLQ